MVMESFIFIILFTLFVVVLLIGGNHNLMIKVKSISSGEIYSAVKKPRTNGNNFIDWFYFDSNGNKIENEKLKLLIFEAFGNEDWYGDYEFYMKSDSLEVEQGQSEVV